MDVDIAVSVAAYADEAHREQVVRLWERVFGYDAPHNAPALAIDRKLAVDDGLFFVALAEGASSSAAGGAAADAVAGTVMAGYDGHRGWIYSLAVHPDRRGRGIGARLLAHAEQALAARGCVKINLQVLPGNGNAQSFYEANGYTVEDRISMGKRLVT